MVPFALEDVLKSLTGFNFLNSENTMLGMLKLNFRRGEALNSELSCNLSFFITLSARGRLRRIVY